VATRSQTEQPVSPAEGETFILPAGATGPDWSGQAANQLASFQDGAWLFLMPAAGWQTYVMDEEGCIVFRDGSWTPLQLETADRFGINTLADPVHRLSVKTDAELLSHDDVTPGSGDARKVINRASADHTASVLFQTGFAGAAEFGLTGDRNLVCPTEVVHRLC
jgi:hypothetical protein